MQVLAVLNPCICKISESEICLFRELCCALFPCKAFPPAEVKLTEGMNLYRLYLQILPYNLSPLECPLKVAGIHCLYRFFCKKCRYILHLQDAYVCYINIKVAVVAELVVVNHLAVTEEIKPGAVHIFILPLQLQLK